MKIDKPTIERSFEYLEGLRDRGSINMWGASPYLARFLGVPDKEGGAARKVFLAWKESFDATGTDERAPRVEWAVARVGDA